MVLVGCGIVLGYSGGGSHGSGVGNGGGGASW